MKKKVGSRSMALKIEAKVKKLPKIKKELLVDDKIKIREIKRKIIDPAKKHRGISIQ